MNNIHLLKASTAMVCKHYVFQRKFVAYNVSINNNFYQETLFQRNANIALTISDNFGFGGAKITAI